MDFLWCMCTSISGEFAEDINQTESVVYNKDMVTREPPNPSKSPVWHWHDEQHGATKHPPKACPKS